MPKSEWPQGLTEEASMRLVIMESFIPNSNSMTISIELITILCNKHLWLCTSATLPRLIPGRSISQCKYSNPSVRPLSLLDQLDSLARSPRKRFNRAVAVTPYLMIDRRTGTRSSWTPTKIKNSYLEGCHVPPRLILTCFTCRNSQMVTGNLLKNNQTKSLSLHLN